MPTTSVVVLKLAMPEALTATLAASVVAPSVNVTVPDGTPAADVTVAVNITDCPNVDGFGVELTAVEVLPCTTCGVPAVPLLSAQPVVPVNDAVIVCLPTASALVLNVACPLALTATFDAQVEAPSVNVTVPTGIPAADATVAVNVTDWPKVDGFGAELTAVVVGPSTVCAVAAVPLLFAQPVAPLNDAVIV